MTLEEKIAHLQTASMEQARAEGNAIDKILTERLWKRCSLTIRMRRNIRRSCGSVRR